MCDFERIPISIGREAENCLDNCYNIVSSSNGAEARCIENMFASRYKFSQRGKRKFTRSDMATSLRTLVKQSNTQFF
jgi:hypothetical protein